MGGRRIEIDWDDVLPNGAGDVEVSFASDAAPVRPGGAARAAAEEVDVVMMTDGDLRTAIAESRSLGGRFKGILSGGGEGNRRRRKLLEDEARRRAAAKDGDGRRSAAQDVYAFNNEDQLEEYESRRSYGKSSPIYSTKENYGQLGVQTCRSFKQIVKQKPFSVDKMYSSKPCPSTLYGHKLRVHAIDPDEKTDDEKSQPSNTYTLRNSTKRWKEKHQACLPDFQKVDMLISDKASIPKKVRDVVLLDDEDGQLEAQVDCEMHDIWKESKIYYPSRDDPEAVELSSSDIKCLDPGVYLSSPVINYYIQYLKRTKLHDDDCRDRFYIFNTYFYSKLEEALLGKGEFVKLRRWWKGVNIYHTAYIILPIHGTAHWSLVIICIPSKESNSGPIILHLDSLEMHSSAKIFDTIGRYLEAEWCHLQKNDPSNISISEEIWEDLPRNIQKEKVQVPQQRNEYDCGIFMLYYIERFIREAPERFTRDNLGMFSRSWFQPEDASELRQRIRELLLEEFESARLDDALSEAGTTDGSDNEDTIKIGEPKAAAAASSDSPEMIVEIGDTGISNEEIKDAAASSNEEINDAAASGEGSFSICTSADKLTGCVLSEAATLSDSAVNDEEGDDITKAESVGSQNEQDIAVLSPRTWKNSEEKTHRPREPEICCDSSDSETDDVKIIEVPSQRTNKQKCKGCISE